MSERKYVTKLSESDRSSELYSSSKSVWCRSEIGSECGSEYTDARSIINDFVSESTLRFSLFTMFIENSCL